MKIAVLGKGGSGKSTVSWLLINYLASIDQKVLAIDADHNMDLVSCLGLDEIQKNKSFHNSINEVRKILQLDSKEHWSHQFHTDREVDWKGQYTPSDEFLSKYLIPVSKNIDLLSLGLGDEDVMYIGRCAHGLSAPLKFYLPRLTLTKNTYAVIDSVAGADMVNYGLYIGCDIVCAVVENYTNSIKVARQLHSLFESQGISLKFIINKDSGDSELLNEFRLEFGDEILGTIPLDIAIMKYNFDEVNEKALQKLSQIHQAIFDQPKNTNGYEMLKNFELKRKSHIVSKN